MRLENKAALITGAASGMGASMARVFAAEGAKVVVADVNQPAAADVAKEISGRMNIPVVVYPDASHHVEPSNADVEAKLRELSLI